MDYRINIAKRSFYQKQITNPIQNQSNPYNILHRNKKTNIHIELQKTPYIQNNHEQKEQY